MTTGQQFRTGDGGYLYESEDMKIVTLRECFMITELNRTIDGVPVPTTRSETLTIDQVIDVLRKHFGWVDKQPVPPVAGVTTVPTRPVVRVGGLAGITVSTTGQ